MAEPTEAASCGELAVENHLATEQDDNCAQPDTEMNIDREEFHAHDPQEQDVGQDHTSTNSAPEHDVIEDLLSIQHEDFHLDDGLKSDPENNLTVTSYPNQQSVSTELAQEHITPPLHESPHEHQITEDQSRIASMDTHQHERSLAQPHQNAFDLGQSILRTPKTKTKLANEEQRQRVLQAQLRCREKMARAENIPSAFLATKVDLDDKHAAPSATMEDGVQFHMMENEDHNRLKEKKAEEASGKAEPRQGAEEGNQLFLSSNQSPKREKRSRTDDEQQSELDQSGASDSDNLEESESRPSKRSRKNGLLPRSTKVKIPEDVLQASSRAGLQAIFQSGRCKKRRQHPSGISAKKPKGGRKKSKSTATNAAAENPDESGKRQPKRRRKASEPKLADVQSIWASNVFKDAKGNNDRPDQPTFTNLNKNKALQDLLNSVPEESRRSAKRERTYFRKALADFKGHGSARSDGKGGWKVRGMKTSLKNYQVLGVAFMIRRESSIHKPCGGLHADEMGLGKTVMMLANIVNSRLNLPKNSPKTTLIVASASLCLQWSNEIKLHCEKRGIGRVLRYLPGNKMESHDTQEDLEDYDVIITTYGEIMQSYPKFNPPESCQTPAEQEEWWNKHYDENKGILHRIYFLRVVLDEAHAIKNYKGRTSIACCGLMAKHYWAITGTPIHNSIKELYPYFRFLKVPKTGTYEEFVENFYGKNEPEKMNRLHEFLCQFMIRRTHLDTLFGAPLLKLPNASEKTHECEFNDLERGVYEVVRCRFIEHINTFSRAGTLERRYSNILVMILRLRQLTAHILMLQETIEDLLNQEDIAKLTKLAKKESKGNTDREAQLVALRKLLAITKPKNKQPTDQESNDGGPHEGAETQSTDSAVPEAGPAVNTAIEVVNYDHTGGKHGLEYDFQKYLGQPKEGSRLEENQRKATCIKCGKAPEPVLKTSCSHYYCVECIQALYQEAAENDRNRASCINCGEEFRHAEFYEGEDNRNETPGPENGEKAKKKSRQPKEDTKADWLKIDTPILPSAKTIAVKAQILNWLDEKPNAKIIIYTQFLPMICILSKICTQEKWGFCEYKGTMNFKARAKSIIEFAENDSKRILLASLKCGGLGLNLTMASRVVMIDPWWNNAVEQQEAFCRVFRIGQQEETTMTRFCVKNTIDEYLLGIQERKQKEIDEAMEGGQRRKLSITELMRLFGEVREDGNGKPYIYVEKSGDAESDINDDDDPEFDFGELA